MRQYLGLGAVLLVAVAVLFAVPLAVGLSRRRNIQTPQPQHQLLVPRPSLTSHKFLHQPTKLPSKGLRLYCLDFHLSVVEDVTSILNHMFGSKIHIQCDFASNYARFRGLPKARHAVFKHRDDLKALSSSLIQHVNEKYHGRFSQFDGFLVTHTPPLALIYEAYNKPVFVVNSTRYEHPSNQSLVQWEWVNQGLRRMHKKGLLHIVSNNAADQEYLRLGSGLPSPIVPSLCMYTNMHYSPQVQEIPVFWSSDGVKLPSGFMDHPSLVPKPRDYKFEDLQKYLAIVHIPYEVSTMTIFEHYSAGIPLLVPSKSYLKDLLRRDDNSVSLLSRYSLFMGCKQWPKALDIAFQDATYLDFWLDRADFYTWPHIITFDSIADFHEKLVITDFAATSMAMQTTMKQRKGEVFQFWKSEFETAFPCLHHETTGSFFTKKPHSNNVAGS